MDLDSYNSVRNPMCRYLQHGHIQVKLATEVLCG